MSKRRTPEQRLHDAQQDSIRARRHMLQARLDVAAAIAERRGWPAKSTAAIRRVLDTCELFDWDLDRAEILTRAVELQFETVKPQPLAEIADQVEAAAQAMGATA